MLTNEARDLAARGFMVSSPNCSSASSLLTGTMIGQLKPSLNGSHLERAGPFMTLNLPLYSLMAASNLISQERQS